MSATDSSRQETLSKIRYHFEKMMQMLGEGPQKEDRLTAFEASSGMTLRDYFAAKAMHALKVGGIFEKPQDGLLAERSYDIADAMIKEREKK